jgi:hypothetical protein
MENTNISLDESEQFEQFIQSVAGRDWAMQGEVFLLLDGARLPGMSAWLERQGSELEWVSLFSATIGTSLLAVSPVLLCLPVRSSENFLLRALHGAAYRQAASLLVSKKTLAELAEHLVKHLYVDDPDGTRWVLAIWDPFVLSSLVGLRPATSPLVPGPILTAAQQASLLFPFAWWCFRDLEGKRRAIRATTRSDEFPDLPFVLTRVQFDQLMDISLPEQVCKVLHKAQPEVTLVLSNAELQEICANAIRLCRDQGRDDFSAYCDAAYEILAQR